jgi:TolA-binding protein
MSHIRFCAPIAVAIALSLTGLAHAQAANPLSPLSKGLWTRPDYDRIYAADRVDEFARRELVSLHKTATASLDAKDYAAAEATLSVLVDRDPTTTDARFLMGLAKIGLGKWSEARTWLEAAVKEEPARPEPKTRLGLTYV